MVYIITNDIHYRTIPNSWIFSIYRHEECYVIFTSCSGSILETLTWTLFIKLLLTLNEVETGSALLSDSVWINISRALWYKRTEKPAFSPVASDYSWIRRGPLVSPSSRWSNWNFSHPARRWSTRGPQREWGLDLWLSIFPWENTPKV